MCDLFDGAIQEVDEREQLEEEARRTREHYWNIGYKLGISEARQEELIQHGFDEGFHQGAINSFCRSFSAISNDQDISESLYSPTTGSMDDKKIVFNELLQWWHEIRNRLVKASSQYRGM